MLTTLSFRNLNLIIMSLKHSVNLNKEGRQVGGGGVEAAQKTCNCLLGAISCLKLATESTSTRLSRQFHSITAQRKRRVFVCTEEKKRMKD